MWGWAAYSAGATDQHGPTDAEGHGAAGAAWARQGPWQIDVGMRCIGGGAKNGALW